MEYESMSPLNVACAAFFMISTVVFFYYLYLLIKGYLRCKSEMKEELPCPNTCNPGYECKQSEASADFLIGEVDQEGISEDDKQEESPELTEETPEFTEVAEVAEAPELPAIEATS